LPGIASSRWWSSRCSGGDSSVRVAPGRDLRSCAAHIPRYA
jgi:hypothetical protein